MEAYKRLCHNEKVRVWTAWAATVPFILGYSVIVATVFWGVFSVTVTAIIALILFAVGLVVDHLSGGKYAIFPFIYCDRERPGKEFSVVKYKTYWGTSRSTNYIWQEAVRLLPGLYRLRGKTFESSTGNMYRCPDMFHTEDEYDVSEEEQDV